MNLEQITGIKPAKIQSNQFKALFEPIIEDTNSFYESREVFNNSEFDYKIVIEVNDCYDFDNSIEDSDQKYLVSVDVVKTSKYLPKKELKAVASCCCIPLKDITCWDIATYGLRANLTNFTIESENLDNSLNYIANCLSVYTGLFGFYMDRYQNQIGNTGWDFLDGDIGFKS